MHNQHVMIDLETLSTENDAAIIAIGAVEFDLDRILQERLWRLDPQLTPGRRDLSTIVWWGQQDRAVREFVFGGTLFFEDVLKSLADWILPMWDTHWVWAGPSTFDLSILKTRYQDAGLTNPINWRKHRDLTTLRAVSDELAISSEIPTEGFRAHDPLHDSIKQARRTQVILKSLAHQFDTREPAGYERTGRPGNGDMGG
jgi:DNA polymerase III epsilon subunit-like protein